MEILIAALVIGGLALLYRSSTRKAEKNAEAPYKVETPAVAVETTPVTAEPLVQLGPEKVEAPVNTQITDAVTQTAPAKAAKPKRAPARPKAEKPKKVATTRKTKAAK